MPLFQKTILEKHKRSLNPEKIDAQWKLFTAHFHDPVVQQNIRNSKEEQYQEGFVNDLFVKVLGYVKNPAPDYNFITEQKNEGDSKKADGAILIDGKVRAVVELKGCNTTDLGKVEPQAFGYKNRQPGCDYVVVSNFEKLRFYVENAVEHLEFNLFELTKKDFALLWLCMSHESIQKDLPLKLKSESLSTEDQITKDLYRDYSVFRRELFNDLLRKNPETDKLLLFKKTQKLLDRFLFIFFAEDRLLLPVNLIKKIIAEWEQLREMRVEHSLYERFKLYFNDLNAGNAKQDIFAYNGGLFQPDEILDNLQVDDQLLHDHTHKLSTYDFESEVDVNILGHIFENSLNEIEEIENQVLENEAENVTVQVGKTSKRKKDGVFYTPKYITKYIVENTLGKLCTEKKAALEITDEIYSTAKKRSKKRLDNLQQYRDWLLQLSICDPACGSGAFLNQALEFLIEEHRYVDELSAKYNDDPLVLSDVETSILENNLYGVDINEESVHIAKLSLWLRTAQRNRKLNDLNQNLKCGNSLIDDPEIAGKKAFDWEKEFPQVFEKGGFDVVIGNPPYVDIKSLEPDLVKAFFKIYETTENRINLYSIFIEKGFQLVKNGGFLSYINPNSILVNSSYTKIRKLLLDYMTTIIKLPDDVFVDAKVETIIFELRKNVKSEVVNTLVYSKNEKISFIDELRLNNITKDGWRTNSSFNFNIYINEEQQNLLRKIKFNSIPLGEIADFTLGITPYDKYKGHSQETIKNREFHSVQKLDESYKPLISGANILRYFISNKADEYIKYGDWLGAPREERFFLEPRIIIRQIISGNPPRIYAGYTNEPLYFTQIGFSIIPKENIIFPKLLLALINSSLINFFHKYSFLDLEKELFQKILIANCKKFPINKNALEKGNPKLKKLVDTIIEQIKNLEKLISKFTTYFSGQYNLQKLPRKLENWHELDFRGFVKELNKAIKKAGETPLSKKDEFEWMDLFEENQQKAQALQTQIAQTDRKIDAMVYALYGLTEEEIAVVENS